MEVFCFRNKKEFYSNREPFRDSSVLDGVTQIHRCIIARSTIMRKKPLEDSFFRAYE